MYPILKDHTAEEARGKLGDFADESDDVYVHVVTKIEVEVLDYDTTGEYVLDITPVYEVIASTEQDASKVDLDTNAVELQEPTKFDVQKAATIVIPVPREFAGEGDYIQVTHDHNGNLSYYTVPVENRQIRMASLCSHSGNWRPWNWTA